MSRRIFLQTIVALAGAIALPGVSQIGKNPYGWKTLQKSPVAGFQYYHGESLWSLLTVGQSFNLVRESDNRYDSRAVRIVWQERTLGYIPRYDNAAISQLMDRGEALQAVITKLNQSNNPWERIEVEVRWWV